ncbi:diguanylate cyclase [Thiomicrorhabdus indica]|uniref:diguanylate cyclase n=1 Tax=Thiomicrorhabdus indica TaxID=2267253 RepID=UPI00102DDF86|nr:diguanylate cyclase [Thiomicrorhabdus indica]
MSFFRNRLKIGSVGLLIVLMTLVLAIGYQLLVEKERQLLDKTFQQIQKQAEHQLLSLIDEKQSSSKSIAISLAHNSKIIDLFASSNPSNYVLKNMANQLSQVDEYKNIWVQLIDQNGVAIARSWTESVGQNLSKIRPDLQSFLEQPRVLTGISIGNYDLSFKAMVPIYNHRGEFLGLLEVITHFNSIVERLRKEGFDSLILAQESYFSQIKHPFTNTFVGKRYVANLNANQEDIELFNELNLNSVEFESYFYAQDQNRVVFSIPIMGKNNEKLADYFIFKPITDIDFSLIRVQTNNIKLAVALTLVVLFILFYALGLKRQPNLKHQKSKFKVFIALFIVLMLISAAAFYASYLKEREAYLEMHNQSINKSYEIIKDKYQSVALTTLQLLINKQSVIDLMEQAYNGEQSKAFVRQELQNLLNEDYEVLRGGNLRQLHFHLRNNESLLRMHRPAKFGDNLTGIRKTVEYVNRTYQAIHGFEEGRIFNGYRYIFPITQHAGTPSEQHLGSVEVSFSPYAIAQDFAKTFGINSEFIIKKSVVEEKVFESERDNYIQCLFPNYAFDREMQAKLKSGAHCANIDNQFVDIGKLENQIDKGKVFSVESFDGQKLFTLIPLSNPVTDKVVATYILVDQNDALQNIKSHYLLMYLIGLVIIALTLAFVFKEWMNAQNARQMSQKTQQILDSQKSIVVINDGEDIINVNQAFLDFFEVESLDQFKQMSHCICDHFRRNDRFFHLGKVPEGTSWLEFAMTLKHSERMVQMANHKGEDCIFNFSLSRFSEGRFIIGFNDITDTMLEHFELENRATTDYLTGARNRSYLNHVLPVLRDITKQANKSLGLILFDIDYFKSFNDSYGHNLGDDILKEIVVLVKRTIRDEDLLIRWGGEEFILVVKIHDIQSAERIAENLRQVIAAHEFSEGLKVTCSFGVTLDNDAFEIEDMIQIADQALYKSKDNGRNCVSVKIN